MACQSPSSSPPQGQILLCNGSLTDIATAELISGGTDSAHYAGLSKGGILRHIPTTSTAEDEHRLDHYSVAKCFLWLLSMADLLVKGV